MSRPPKREGKADRIEQVGLGFDANTARTSPPRPRVLTVTQVVESANRALEQSFSAVWVEGELGNLRIAPSGHAYFTLKDERSVLPGAMWKNAVGRLKFRLEQGQRVRVLGRLGIFAEQGKFQMYIERAEPAGLGEQIVELERLKQKLDGEGLFAIERKRPLPRWPKVVGVVTSAHGAAIHDIIEVIGRRCPSRIILAPAIVQGPDAPHELREALARLQARSDVDVIILGRGGGSSEDLSAFNNEGLARAIARSRVPVVSAVGHETDVTIADLVADARAATPSQAAELVVPDVESIVQRLHVADRRLILACERRVLDTRARADTLVRRLERHGRGIFLRQHARLDRCRRILEAHARRLPVAPARRLHALVTRMHAQHPRARLERDRARLDAALRVLAHTGPRLRERDLARLARAAARLHALSPLAVLERGYAVVRSEDRVVTDSRHVKRGDRLRIELRSGRIAAEVVSTEDET